MRLLHILLAWLSFAGSAFSVILEWDANSETNLAGYIVYVGKFPRKYTQTFTNWGGTNTTITITNLYGTNFFAVTAFDTDGLESEYSDEVWTVIKPRPPTGVRFAPTLTVQSAPSVLGPWENVTQIAGAPSGVKFFRMAMSAPEPPPQSAIKSLRFDGSKRGKLPPALPKIGPPFPG